MADDCAVIFLLNIFAAAVNFKTIEIFFSCAAEQLWKGVWKQFITVKIGKSECFCFYMQPSAIADMLKDDQPYLLVVNVEKKGMVYPMIPSGGSVTSIILGE